MNNSITHSIIILGIVFFCSCSSRDQKIDNVQVQKDFAAAQDSVNQLLLEVDSLLLEIYYLELNNQELKTQLLWTFYENDLTKRTYTDSKYGFSFSYPRNSIVEIKKDRNYQYIRVQNYIRDNTTPVTEADLSLAKGEYYMEIMIFDSAKGHKNSQSCQECVSEGKPITLGAYSGYIGLGTSNGDPGGFPFVLCVENSEIQFHIQATDYHQDGRNVTPILDSFKFPQ